MDIFAKFITQNRQNTDCRALTCKSYKEVYKQHYHKELETTKTNTELATLGDALLKFCLYTLLWNENEVGLSEKKKVYEMDKFLIENVAKHYHLLDFMNFNRMDTKIHQEYKFYENNCTKYIATTVEAILGELYLEGYSFTKICSLVMEWTKL